MANKDLSIIIVNYNTRELVLECLNSVYAQTKGIDFDVYVIDNASRDGSAEEIRKRFPQVILFANAVNNGFAAANNQAMRIAESEYLLLLNPDTIVLDGAVQKTLAYARSKPKAAVVGCQVWENEKTIQLTCFRFPSLLNEFLTMTGLGRIFKRSGVLNRPTLAEWDRRSPRRVDVVSGMFMMVKRQAIDQAGIFDEAYFVYGEETDWCRRFHDAGWDMLFWPGARIIHRDGGGSSTKQISVRMYVQMQKSLLIYHRKHGNSFSYLAVRLVFSLYTLWRFSYWSLRALCGRTPFIDNRLACSAAALRYDVFGIDYA